MDTIDVLVPVAETRAATLPLAPRRANLDGARIAWLDNLKANAGTLLAGIAAALASRGYRLEHAGACKNATAAAPASVMAHLMTCDAVVLAIAD